MTNHLSTVGRPSAGEVPTRNRWIALSVLALAQFLVVLDASIVNIALPSIADTFSLDQAAIGWTITAYVLPFGGLLLFGGRLADRYGHRKVFLVGVGLFVGASAAAGLAPSFTILITARAVQGSAAALLAPAALALLTRLFPLPSDRSRALGIWGAVAGMGSAAGVLLGGVLTGSFGWPAVFFINVPVGAAVLIALPTLIARDVRDHHPARIDVPGAILVTLSAVAIVGGLSFAGRAGFADVTTVGLLVAGVAALVAFVIVERWTQNPLVSFDIFRNKHVTSGNVAILLAGAAMTALFFVLALFMQDVLHYSALSAGLSQLPLAAALILTAGIVPSVVLRIGMRSTVAIALLVFSGGTLWLGGATPSSSFVGHLLGPTIIIGVGLGAAIIAATQLAVHGLDDADAGLGGGLFNTSQQIGGAVGIAVIGTVATTRTASLHASGGTATAALAGGYSWAFIGAALLATIGAVMVLVIKEHKK